MRSLLRCCDCESLTQSTRQSSSPGSLLPTDDCPFIRVRRIRSISSYSRSAAELVLTVFSSGDGLPTSCRHSCFGALLHRSTHQVAPCGPRAIVVLHVAIPQQILQ